MRPPPPLTLQCAPSRAWRLACAFIGVSAVLALAAWLAQHLEWALPAKGLAAVCAVLTGVWLGLRIAGPTDRVELRWDGREWHVDGVPGDLQVMLDLERWLLLLRHRPGTAGPARWVAVSFARWGDDLRVLRTALYSRPPEATPDLQPHVRPPDRAPD